MLDGIRAAEQFAPLGLDGVRTPVALWGYSGGGVATGWTAEMQPEYAPELNVIGAPDALNWLAERLDGQAAQPGCDIRTVASTLLDPAAINTLGSSIGAALLAMLGQPLGAGR